MKTKDYFISILTSALGVTFYFGSLYLNSNEWIVYIIVSLGAILGFFASNLIVRSLPKYRWLMGIILLGIVMVGFYSTHTYMIRSDQIALNGTWETDDKNGLIIRFRFEDDNVFMSQSPDFQEVKYSLLKKPGKISLYLNGDLEFDLDVLVMKNNQVQLDNGSDRLLITRVDE